MTVGRRALDLDRRVLSRAIAAGIVQLRRAGVSVQRRQPYVQQRSTTRHQFGGLPSYGWLSRYATSSRGNESRNGEKERQPRCRDPVQIPQQARADGCPGTRHTGNQGNALHQTDDHRVLQVDRGTPGDPACRPARRSTSPRSSPRAPPPPTVAQRARDQAWARKPTIPIGIEPTMTYQANR